MSFHWAPCLKNTIAAEIDKIIFKHFVENLELTSYQPQPATCYRQPETGNWKRSLVITMVACPHCHIYKGMFSDMTENKEGVYVCPADFRHRFNRDKDGNFHKI